MKRFCKKLYETGRIGRSAKVVIVLLLIALPLLLVFGLVMGVATVAPKPAVQQKPDADGLSQQAHHYEGIAVEPGSPYIDAPLLSPDGEEVKISDFLDGKPIYLVFWEEWCPQCQAEFPYIESVYKDYKDKVHFIVVHRADSNVDDISQMEAFINENGYTLPIFFNIRKEATSAYGSPTIPTNIFIQSNGTVFDVYTDVMDMTEEMIRSCIQGIVNAG